MVEYVIPDDVSAHSILFSDLPSDWASRETPHAVSGPYKRGVARDHKSDRQSNHNGCDERYSCDIYTAPVNRELLMARFDCAGSAP